MAPPRRVRRATRPSARSRAQPGARASATSIVSLLAHGTKLNDVLPALHQQAIEAAGGSCSLLFETSPHRGRLQPTSGFLLDTLDLAPWQPTAAERVLLDETFTRGVPTVVADARHRSPGLATRLGTPSVCLVPLATGDRRLGVLAIGRASRAALTTPARLAEAADGFVVALELVRLRQQDDLHEDVRKLLDEFAATVAATLDVRAGLDIVCHRANRLFGSDRTSVWIHDRGARHLELQASSDREYLATDQRVSTDDLLAPAAAAMRRSRSAILRNEASTVTVTVPLRGWRRALGALVLDGVRLEPGGELPLLTRADEVARQISSTLDSLQLLDEIARARTELEGLFDAMPSLIVVSDHRGRIVQANAAFAARLRTTPARLRGRLLTECVGAELGAWLEAQASPHRSEAPISRELSDPVLGHALLVTATDRLGPDRRPTGLVLIARELASGDRVDVEHEEVRRRTVQSEKLTALGQFVAGLAHELNNPLQGVLGHLDLIRATRTLPRDFRASIRTVYREADRAAKIVRNLLMFAGSRRTVRRRISLHAVLQKVLGLRQAACRALEIEVVRHYGDHLPRVQGDPLLLHQVFLNMFMNAEQSIAAAGRPGRIEITTTAGRQRVVVTMRDTGGGIGPESLKRVFEPFYTTKEVGQGTGLGLAMAYGIIQDHGGSIAASNHPDGGAVLTVDLPAAPPPTT